MAKQKRDSAYYLGLVERDHPAIYARYLAGEFRSVAAAIQAAGLRRPPTTLHALRRAWKAATAAEKADFLAWSGLAYDGLASASARRPPVSIATADRRLTEHAKRRFKALFPMVPFPCGYIMSAIGRPTTDVSLRLALMHGYKLQPSLIAKLEVWLPAEEERRRALAELSD